MCKLGGTIAVTAEELAADVRDCVVGELERGIEAEGAGALRVVSPCEPVHLADEVAERVVVGEVTGLEGLAATAELGVEDPPAEGGHVADVVDGAAALVRDRSGGDAGEGWPLGLGRRAATELLNEERLYLLPVAADEVWCVDDAAVLATVRGDRELVLADELGVPKLRLIRRLEG